MKWMRLAPAFLLIVLHSACGRGEAEGSRDSFVRDSAGARIVDNGQAPASRWHTGESPLFTVGWGSDAPTFTWVQSGRILPDGGAVVGDFAAGAIYRIGADGSVVATWGRKGEGPGEYQGLDAILVLGDSIVVSDGRLRRITVLSGQGVVLATHPLVGTFLHHVSSTLPDGRLLLVPGEGYSGVNETRPEWVFETQPVLALDLEGGSTDTLADLPHLRRWLGTRGASPGPVTVRGRASGLADGFAWARADHSEVRWYDHTGALTQIGRWREDPPPLTPEWRADVVQILVEAYASSGAEPALVATRLAELEEGFDRHEGPLPYWDAFHVDRQGNAWLREYAPPGQPSGRWRVVTRDGTFMGWVDLPDVVAILDITDDRVLAVRLDDLDVPAVVMIPLLKM
jgi:hypothetical protein